jgi:hypothetical protein
VSISSVPNVMVVPPPVPSIGPTQQTNASSPKPPATDALPTNTSADSLRLILLSARTHTGGRGSGSGLYAVRTAKLDNKYEALM